MPRKYEKKNLKYWNSFSVGSPAQNESKNIESWEPSGFSYASDSSENTTRGRRNRVTTNPISDKYKNIVELELPFHSTRTEKECVNIREAVLLCQKAYAHIPSFRATIDIMTEFSSADVHLRGGNKESREFVSKWLKKINIGQLADQFFREYYRSGNVFVYKFQGNFTQDIVKKIKKLYSDAASTLKIPIRYTVLNPYDVVMYASSSIDLSLYTKVLSPYEIAKLKARNTPEDQDVYDSLPEKVKKQIDSNTVNSYGIHMNLEKDRLAAVFYKKQDYEPFAIPFGYPVLDDINHKLELKKIDRAISRTIQQAVLLVTMGAEPDKGGINKKAMLAMKQLLENETVGRTVVSDFTTKMEFIIPEIGTILDPKKYEIVNQDIKDGLQNIILGTEEKFSNQQTKAKVFIERLKEGRKMFIREFLQPEIKKVCREIGFKSYPDAFFEEIDLQDEVQFHRIWIRLLELGVLDPQQAFKAMKTGVLPSDEELQEAQKTYIDKRKEGYYVPLVGGSSMGEDKKEGGPNPNSSSNGRPAGSSSTRTPAPRGVNKASVSFSLKEMKGSLMEFTRLVNDVEKDLRSRYKIRKLDEDQKSFAFSLAENIVYTNERKDWAKVLDEALSGDNSFDMFEKNGISLKIDNLANEYDIDGFQASLLYHSSKK